jgi:hypothetical protein
MGEEMFESACLAHLRGQAIAMAPFLIHLTPCLIAFAPDLTALDREEVETADWSNECDDLVDDFVEEGGIRRVKKDIGFYSLLNSEARSR